MTTSNLTNRERDVLAILPTVEPRWGMAIKIAEKMITRDGYPVQPNNVQLYLGRLVESGHVRKIRRGVYVRTQ